MTYKTRLPLLMLLDVMIILTAVYLAVVITYPTSISFDTLSLTIITIVLLFFYFLFAFIFNIYNKVWAYASVGELRSIVFTVSLTVLSATVVQFFLTDYTIYRRGLVVTWLFYIVLMGGSRFLWRVVRDEYIVKNKNKVRTLIVGAGDAGAMIVRQLSSASNGSDLQPVGLVEDRKSTRLNSSHVAI